MIRVFIVEDEPPILRVIKQMIEQTNAAFKIVGEALNGKIALPSILSLKPDIVFTDIRMPVMDGLTLLEKLENMPSKPLTVILSGFQEFEYAKRAIKYDVFDYLIKPVSIEALQNILNELQVRYDCLKKAKQLNTLRMMIDNIPNPLLAAGGTASISSELFNSRQYVCMFLCSGSYSSSYSNTITPGKDFWLINDLENIVEGFNNKSFDYWVLNGKYGNEKFIIIGADNLVTDEINNFCNDIHNALTSGEIPITTVVSNNYANIEQVTLSISKLTSLMSRSVIFAKSQIFYEGDQAFSEKKDEFGIFNASWESLFSMLIQNRQSSKFKQNLDSLLEICEKGKCRQLLLEKLLQRVFGLFRNVGIASDGKILKADIEIEDLISCSINYKTLFEGLSYIADDLFEQKKTVTNSNENNNEIVLQIEQYLRANYTKPISLQTLSDVFSLAPQYLGRKFKSAIGVSPNDYIINLRIEKAKDLLKSKTSLSLQDISDAVGYNNPFYLSRIFKAVTGLSPSEFKEKY